MSTEQDVDAGDFARKSDILRKPEMGQHDDQIDTVLLPQLVDISGSSVLPTVKRIPVLKCGCMVLSTMVAAIPMMPMRNPPLWPLSTPSPLGAVHAGGHGCALAGLGWGMNPLALVEAHLAAGRLVEVLPGHRLDVELHWQNARLGARLLDTLNREVIATAWATLIRMEAAERSYTFSAEARRADSEPRSLSMVATGSPFALPG